MTYLLQRFSRRGIRRPPQPSHYELLRVGAFPGQRQRASDEGAR